jgi:hypothetical protein
MRNVAKRMVVAVVAILVVAASGLWLAGAGLAQAQDGVDRPTDSAATQNAEPVAQPRPLSMDELRAVADYVSPDGSYVKMGDVEISATVVTSAALD